MQLFHLLADQTRGSELPGVSLLRLLELLRQLGPDGPNGAANADAPMEQQAFCDAYRIQAHRGTHTHGHGICACTCTCACTCSCECACAFTCCEWCVSVYVTDLVRCASQAGTYTANTHIMHVHVHCTYTCACTCTCTCTCTAHALQAFCVVLHKLAQLLRPQGVDGLEMWNEEAREHGEDVYCACTTYTSHVYYRRGSTSSRVISTSRTGCRRPGKTRRRTARSSCRR